MTDNTSLVRRIYSLLYACGCEVGIAGLTEFDRMSTKGTLCQADTQDNY